MSEALYTNNEVQSLIHEDNIFDGIFDCLRHIWDRTNAIAERHLADSEYRTRLLEKELHRFYPALYEDLQDQTGNHPVATMDSGSGIIMDALSLREGFKLAQDLQSEHEDWHTEISWAMVETLPSETTFACRVWFDAHSPSAVNRDDYQFIGSRDVPKLPGTDPEYVWTRLPDERLEQALKGNYSMEEVEEIYQTTKQLLKDVIHESVHTEFLVTSDHGYINNTGNNPYTPFGSDEEAALKAKFSGRHEEAASGQGYQLLLDKGIIERVSDQFVVRGHYDVTRRGATSQIKHGGMSLMECMTPVLQIKTEG